MHLKLTLSLHHKGTSSHASVGPDGTGARRGERSAKRNTERIHDFLPLSSDIFLNGEEVGPERVDWLMKGEVGGSG